MKEVQTAGSLRKFVHAMHRLRFDPLQRCERLEHFDLRPLGRYESKHHA